jgi:hypothetical protein
VAYCQAEATGAGSSDFAREKCGRTVEYVGWQRGRDKPLGVVREEATRRDEGGSHLGVVREVAIRHGEKCCFTQGEED